MALSATQKTSIRWYLGYPETSVIGSSPLESGMDTISATAEARVLVVLEDLVAVEEALRNGLGKAGLKRVEEVEWFQDGAGGLGPQRAEGARLCHALAQLLGVPVHRTPFDDGPRSGRSLRG